MIEKTRRIMLIFLSVILLSACTAEMTPEGTSPALPEAVFSVKEELSFELQIPLDNIEVISYSEQDWSDSCLGLGTAEEICAQVITPGWRVVLESDGTQYIYRTDISADIIRREQ